METGTTLPQRQESVENEQGICVKKEDTIVLRFYLCLPHDVQGAILETSTFKIIYGA